MNKSKPKLYKNYLQKSDYIFIDLIINKDIESEVDLICQSV